MCNGRGEGMETLAMHSHTYTEVDKNRSLINMLKSKYPDYHFYQATFPPFPFDDGSFDTIVSLHVIEHVQKDAFFLSEVKRVLKKEDWQ